MTATALSVSRRYSERGFGPVLLPGPWFGKMKVAGNGKKHGRVDDVPGGTIDEPIRRFIHFVSLP